MTLTMRNLAFTTAVFVLLFGVQVALQFLRGAFTSEFAGHADEAAHYVTGLMVRDYLASLQFTAPIRFAENYYIHYPQVAIGHWPPTFYVVQAMWTLPFSPTRGSVILLMSLLTTLLAGTVYIVIRDEFDASLGILGGFISLALPLVQYYSGMVMAEVLLALLVFLSVLSFARFLDTGKTTAAIGFGIFASLAILTKGNALLLVLFPSLALLFSRRLRLVGRLSFWWPVAIVLFLCGPWYWLTHDMARTGLPEDTLSLKYTTAAIGYYSSSLVQITGFGLSVVVAIGFFARVIKPFATQGASGTWAAMGALLVSTWLFACVIPTGLGDRYIIPAVPALLMFLVAGLVWMAARLPLHQVSRGRKEAVLAVAIAVLFSAEAFSMPPKAWSGLAAIAQNLVSTPGLRNSVFLISSDSTTEGVFVSEVAMHETRPGHIVLRASKVLASADWLGREYRSVYRTPTEIMSYLEEVPIGVVVMDVSIPHANESEHHALLKRALLSYSDRWESLGTYPVTKDGVEYANALLVYRLIGHETKTPAKIQLDMSRMLGRTIVR